MTELTGYVIDAADVLIDDASGDVGLRVNDWLLIFPPEMAAHVGNSLIAASRVDRPAVSPAKWTRP